MLTNFPGFEFRLRPGWLISGAPNPERHFTAWSRDIDDFGNWKIFPYMVDSLLLEGTLAFRFRFLEVRPSHGTRRNGIVSRRTCTTPGHQPFGRDSQRFCHFVDRFNAHVHPLPRHELGQRGRRDALLLLEGSAPRQPPILFSREAMPCVPNAVGNRLQKKEWAAAESPIPRAATRHL